MNKASRVLVAVLFLFVDPFLMPVAIVSLNVFTAICEYKSAFAFGVYV